MNLFQPSHLIILLIVVLLLFGGKKIPELMRGVGQGVGELQKGLNDAKGKLNASVDDELEPRALEPKDQQVAAKKSDDIANV